MGISRGEMLLSFFFNDTATTEIYTLSLHDALPISRRRYVRRKFSRRLQSRLLVARPKISSIYAGAHAPSLWLLIRSEEHTSELQSRFDLVCRLLLEKKKTKTTETILDKCTKSKAYK